MSDSSIGDIFLSERISRRAFLKLLCAMGGITLLMPLVSLQKAFGRNVTNISDNSNVNDLNQVGPDGVSFLCATKPGGFVWFMNTNNPLDSHFERGGGLVDVQAHTINEGGQLLLLNVDKS
ncbi:MAG: hypothetical protein QN716_12540 [Nitrososphaeraceae archaeon]|nr:hypothetical protein [Nitrososphaeraceae archaeon]